MTQPAPEPPVLSRPGVRLDRPVLVGNVVAGTLWLLPLAFASWPLALVGALYVAVASVFLAAVYAHDVLTWRQEAMAWAVPWLAAVALWAWTGAGIEGGGAGSVWPGLMLGLAIGTPCYVAWQFSALIVRHLVTSPSEARTCRHTSRRADTPASRSS